MSCLVTGGAGFIGSHLVEALLKRGAAVRVLDNFTTGRRENLGSLPVEIIDGDVRDTDCVEAAVEGTRVVFHLAALGSVARSVEDPLTTHEINATGTLKVLDACRRQGVKRVVFASSSSVYGNSAAKLKRETAKPRPDSPYAVSKLTGEYYCRVYHRLYGLETACLRYFNVFGPRQEPDSQYAAVIPRFVRAMLHGDRPVIYGDGGQTRDFTYVGNTVEGTLLAATAPRGAGLIANLACGSRYSLLDLAANLRAILDSKLQPEFAEPRLGDIRHSQADVARAERMLGYRPRADFREGLEKTVAWYQESLSRRSAKRAVTAR